MRRLLPVLVHLSLPVLLLPFAACGTKTATDGGGGAVASEDTADVVLADVPDADDAAGPADANDDQDVAGADTGPTVPTCGPQAKFDATASGSGAGNRVGDITLPTLDGDWNLAANWTGCDHYVFVFTAPDPKYTYAQTVWKANVGDLLKNSPPNVHYFFGSYDADDATAADTVQKQKDRVDVALAKLTEEQQEALRAALVARVRHRLEQERVSVVAG